MLPRIGFSLSWTALREPFSVVDRVFALWRQQGRALRLAFFIAALVAAVAIVSLPFTLSAATNSKKLPVVPKWSRFEQTLKSSVGYSNAFQDVTMTVRFKSPLGETNQVYGFWDGGRTWRIRFSPDQPGRWSFVTTCSDPANRGLHNRSGEFICTAPVGPTRFNRHGPIQVAEDRRHLEHADRTPFFWLADTAWNGARVSGRKDWEVYAQTRALQQFTVVQWALAPGLDTKEQAAATVLGGRLMINPESFQRLDAKLDTLSRAGLLSAIAPYAELPSTNNSDGTFADDQIALLARYAVARWGAEPVAWVLGMTQSAKEVARWKRIGHAVFNEGQHAPVMVYVGGAPEAIADFRDENWVGMFGFQSAMAIAASTPAIVGFELLSKALAQKPARVMIPFGPCENGVETRSEQRFEADTVRRAVYSSLLLASPAGVSYCAQGVMNWDSWVQSPPDQTKGDNLPLWRKALFMPAAKQMTHLSEFLNSMEFWRLRPRPQLLAEKTAGPSPLRSLAASTETKDLALVYVPRERSAELMLDGLPLAPDVAWFNPASGKHSHAVAVVGARTCQFPTPGPGDWVLVLKTGR
jgi:hypothetical protein